jgi:hypothetical protein
MTYKNGKELIVGAIYKEQSFMIFLYQLTRNEA